MILRGAMFVLGCILLSTSDAWILSRSGGIAPWKNRQPKIKSIAPFSWTFRRSPRYCSFSFEDVVEGEDNDDDDDDSDEAEDEDAPDNDDSSDDWLQAEFFLRTAAPVAPSPELTAETVARTVVRSLQFVDYTTEDGNATKSAGLQRCFEFLTYDCRKAVTGRQGATTVERFIEYGLTSPALQPFMGAKSVQLHAATYTPAQPPYRGALASFPVTIAGPDLLSLQYPSGMQRNGVASQSAVTTHMVLRLEQQRRPPCCWLVREILDVRYAFAGDMGNDIPE